MAQTLEERRERNRVYQREYFQRNRDACNAATKDWYRRNKAAHSATVTARRSRHKQLLEEYKAARGCAHCGIGDPRVLAFHHVTDDKAFTISNRYTANWDRLLAEADKCIILCANCHLIEHADARTN